jgi:hypothetical protein
MKVFRSARWLLLALLLPLIPAPKANAGVFISVNFGPPVMPVYVQPPCPQPNLMWTPGYWAYGPDGYYWVPGAWVPAPYMGALWTPPYWGWSGGVYMFHPGYWGAHVGYYGGINYGFGYMGVGFVGGMWSGGAFRYNTAIVNVNRTYINNVYVDRTIVQRNTIVNNSRVAYNGGPNGIRYQPSAQERSYMNERHTAPTSFQTQHAAAARADRTAYARNNGGRPSNLVASRPLQREAQAPAARPGNSNARPESRPSAAASRPSQPRQEARPAQQREARPAQQREARPAQQRESRPAQQRESRPEPKDRR